MIRFFLGTQVGRAILATLAVVAMLAGMYTYAYHRGATITKLKYEAKHAAALEAAHKLSLALRQSEQRLAQTQTQLEDQAHAQPARNADAIPRSRVLRLNQRQLPASVLRANRAARQGSQ